MVDPSGIEMASGLPAAVERLVQSPPATAELATAVDPPEEG